MKKKIIFTIQYALLCTLLTFLLITVFGKHYQLEATFVMPCLSAFPGTFLSGWLFFNASKRFWHIRIGLFALLFTFLFCWIGFLFYRLNAPDSIFQVSLLKAVFDAWLSFLDGLLIMVPAFVLLVYVAKAKEPQLTEEAENHEEEDEIGN